MRIIAVVGDMGGAEELIPVVGELEKSGHHRAQWVVCPSPQAKAGDKLGKANIPFERRLPQSQDADADLILIGTSATAAEAQIAFTEFVCYDDTPVVWFEDLYGTGSTDKVRGVSPDLMLTIDSIAAGIAKRVRPELQVIPVGKPSFTALAPKIQEKLVIRQKLIESCGLAPDPFVVTCVLGSKGLTEHIDALKGLPSEINGRLTTLVLRLHPKLPEADRKAALDSALEASHLRITIAPNIPTDEAVIAADVSLNGPGSTEQYKSVLAGVPACVLMFPDTDRLRKELSEKGYLNGKTPLVYAGAGIEITNSGELLNVLKDCVHPACQTIMSRDAQPFGQLLDPNAAAVAAREILGFCEQFKYQPMD